MGTDKQAFLKEYRDRNEVKQKPEENRLKT